MTDDGEAAKRVRKWSTQAREIASWYQHEELGYNYRMSNVIAGVVRGQIPYLEEHISQKKAIYLRYKEAFEKAGLPVEMNPYDKENSEPNFWLSCLLIKPEAMSRQVRGEQEALYIRESGKSCPTEILEALTKYNAHAYAAVLSDEPVCYEVWERKGKNRCLYRRQNRGCLGEGRAAAGCGGGYF